MYIRVSYQNLKKDEYSSIQRSDNISREVEKLTQELDKKDEQLKKYAEENENVRRYNEVLRSELISVKSESEKKENEIAIMSQKLMDCEREKLVKE